MSTVEALEAVLEGTDACPYAYGERVVKVQIYRTGEFMRDTRCLGVGSGTLLTMDGVVCTAQHVIAHYTHPVKPEAPHTISAKLPYRGTYELDPQFPVLEDTEHDLAIFKVKTGFRSEPAGVAISATRCHPSDAVTLYTFQQNTVSAHTGRVVRTWNEYPFDRSPADALYAPRNGFSATVPAIKGYSGSPLVNVRGEYTGTLVLSLPGSTADETYGGAIQGPQLRELLERALREWQPNI